MVLKHTNVQVYSSRVCALSCGLQGWILTLQVLCWPWLIVVPIRCLSSLTLHSPCYNAEGKCLAHLELIQVVLLTAMPHPGGMSIPSEYLLKGSLSKRVAHFRSLPEVLLDLLPWGQTKPISFLTLASFDVF